MENENTLYLLTVSDEAGRAEKEAFCCLVEKLGGFLDINAGVSTVCADVGDIADESFCAVFAFGAGADETVGAATGRNMRIAGVFEKVDGASAMFALLAAVRKAFPYVTVKADGGKLLVCGQECLALGKTTDAWLKTNAGACPVLVEIAEADNAMSDKIYKDCAGYALALREKKAALGKINELLDAAVGAAADQCRDLQYGEDIAIYRNAVISAEEACLAIKNGKTDVEERVEAAEGLYRKLLEINYRGYVRAYLEFLLKIAYENLQAQRKDKALSCLIKYAGARAEAFMNCPDSGLPPEPDVALDMCALASEASDADRDRLTEILSSYGNLAALMRGKYSLELAQMSLVCGVFEEKRHKETAIGYLKDSFEIAEGTALFEVADSRIFVAAAAELAGLYQQDGRMRDADKIMSVTISECDLVERDPEEYLGEFLQKIVLPKLNSCDCIDHDVEDFIRYAQSVAESVYVIDRHRHAETLADFYTGLSRLYCDKAMETDVEALAEMTDAMLEKSYEYREKARRVREER